MPKIDLILRLLVAGPMSAASALALMVVLAILLPGGQAQVDGWALAKVSLPVLWLTVFLYAVLEPRLLRAWCVMAVLIAVAGTVIAWEGLS